MNVVVFGNSTGFGGAQTAFRPLVDFFVADGHAVGAIGLVGSDDQFPSSEKAVFSARIHNRNTSHIRKLWQTFRAGSFAASHQPDLFVSVGLANSASMIARRLPKRTFCLCQDF